MVIKSRLSLLTQIEQKVKSLHSYKVPEVIAMPIVGGSEDYTQWVVSNTLEQ
jgi:periplasmic divalent cation tolerance protein